MDFLATPNRRRLLFAALYFSEGAPIGFIWNALPTRMRSLGVEIDQVTLLTSVLVLPWALKFLWAPIIDVFQGRSWTLRHWVLAAQAAMVASLAPLFWLDLQADLNALRVWLLVHAIAAATQDAAIDAMCIRIVDVSERGRLNGWMQAGTLLGRGALGGGALLLFDLLGDTGVVVLLMVATGSSSMLIWSVVVPTRRSTDLRASLFSAGRLGTTWLGLAFAMIGGAAFEALGAVTGPMLIDAGWSEESIGLMQAAPLIIAMAIGSLCGGYLADRRGHLRTVAAALVFVAVNVAIVAGCWSPVLDESTRRSLLPVFVGTNAFAVGLLTAASFALLMDLTVPGAAATQFSAYMGATNGCEAWSGFLVGKLIAGHGYGIGLGVMAAASLTALPIVYLIRRCRETHRAEGEPDGE